MNPDIERVLVTEAEIAQSVKKLGQEISQDYQGRKPLVIGILKGSVIFMSDLVRQMSVDLELDFMAVSSYGASTESSGVVKIIKDLDRVVEGRDLIIVEDIVDTGRTLAYLKQLLANRNAASIKIVALLNKESRREVAIQADYIGFEIDDLFVVGYGMDYSDQYRGLPYIGVLKEDVYK
ncbi:hypoxanthine phosphoribosyltransferase [Aerococcus urinaehominis]|uniref:Hypoxanthine phosphoribosyltransferase n=1 Tax=Aerococcus urinaehominis TaxID=128944 RepID=A0A0X8FKU8_9LACT|nr:hypoxanthine phosphoribosyltransferase [Aerococcus urinaehominis]AMB99164.1 hypoxanthine phosphoribosyltransferase [Aerococcus urinaehominis]SDM05919.1 hypoxanthine phosphoribosyltransferase [Aerococcus urinaehominis]